MAGELLDLLSLLVDDAGGVIDVVINEVLIGLVDEWCQEEDRSRNEGKAPYWDDLNQIIREESTEQGLMVSVSFCASVEVRLTATDAKTFSAKRIR